MDSHNGWITPEGSRQDQTAENIYAEVVLTQTVTWEGERYDLIWVEGEVETQAIIDRHFWEYDVDLSKPN